MAAVETVLQVHSCLANDVIRPHHVVVHHPDNQLCLHRKGQSEFKHPERHDTIRRGPTEAVGRRRVQHRYRLSKDGVQLFGDVSLFAVHGLLPDSDQQVGVGFAIQVCGGQTVGLWTKWERKKDFETLQLINARY